MDHNLIKEDANKLGILLTGFFVMSLGITFNRLSGMGLSSWNIFHDGLSNHLGITFGVVTQLLGLVILLFSVVFLKTKVGPGTILNILLIGFLVDKMEEYIVITPESIGLRIALIITGILLMTMGRALYISSRLGPGPRDGLFVGISRVTNIQVKYIKPAIEFTVLIIGILLGGKFGVGTVLTIIVSGYLVQFFFKVFHFDPKGVPNRSLREYIK